MSVTVLFSAKEIDACLEDFLTTRFSKKFSGWQPCQALSPWWQKCCLSLKHGCISITCCSCHPEILLKAILSITSESDIVCHFWNRYCLSLLKSILSVTSEINIVLSLLKSMLSITSASNAVWCSGKQVNTKGSQIAQNGLEPRVYCVRVGQG